MSILDIWWIYAYRNLLKTSPKNQSGWFVAVLFDGRRLQVADIIAT